MTKIHLHAETIRQIVAQGGTWAIYVNTAFDSSSFGQTVCLRYGEGATLPSAPAQMPDTPQYGPGWKYQRLALVDARRLPSGVEGDVEIEITPRHSPQSSPPGWSAAAWTDYVVLMGEFERLLAPTDREDAWEIRYAALFSDRMIARAIEMRGAAVQYYDPDTSYEEDVRACVTAYLEDYKTLAAAAPQER